MSEAAVQEWIRRFEEARVELAYALNEVERLRAEIAGWEYHGGEMRDEVTRLRRIEEAAYRLRNWWERDGWPRYGPMNDREFVGAVRQPILNVFAALADQPT